MHIEKNTVIIRMYSSVWAKGQWIEVNLQRLKDPEGPSKCSIKLLRNFGADTAKTAALSFAPRFGDIQKQLIFDPSALPGMWTWRSWARYEGAQTFNIRKTNIKILNKSWSRQEASAGSPELV